MNKPTSRPLYRDPKICVDYLCGFCPNELANGHCTREHNPQCRIQYQKEISLDPSKSLHYEHEKNLYAFVHNRDQGSPGWKGLIQRVHPTTEKLERLKRQLDGATQAWLLKANDIEVFDGTQGKGTIAANLEELHKKDEKRQRAKEELEEELKKTEFMSPAVEFCDICGNYVPTADGSRDHDNSKVHLGYVKIRERIKEIISRKESHRPNALSR
ncbi:hypothetical protein BDB00DRAFT_805314 [Zychaea mexicana]|uniref:uncharacterized protein n=1 Tax=Zychaea mexicana TaxID=64656 RepID=UPI0022FF3085|nr:uncharacterized protein BDB00DRAFT_805314 [Zychaea mexicana]KAI9497176.1 hypothetical protein BDB00DRAFT_805314 [Zychaea mexicana]